jgi:hypothetical protein
LEYHSSSGIYFFISDYNCGILRVRHPPETWNLKNGASKILEMWQLYDVIPVVPHKAVAEVSKIGNL